jgi:hypothetical protein
MDAELKAVTYDISLNPESTSLPARGEYEIIHTLSKTASKLCVLSIP